MNNFCSTNKQCNNVGFVSSKCKMYEQDGINTNDFTEEKVDYMDLVEKGVSSSHWRTV